MSDAGEPGDADLVGAGGQGSIRRPVVLWLSAIAVAVVFGGTLLVLVWPQVSTVEEFHQPESLTYPDGQSHDAVLEHHYSFASEIGIRSDRYKVRLGASAITRGYGHVVELDVMGGDPEDLAVEWELEGAWLNYGSGHRVFVPAESFLGR